MTEEQIEELVDTLLSSMPQELKLSLEEWSMLRDKFFVIIRDRT
jgi:hypothetical protein